MKASSIRPSSIWTASSAMALGQSPLGNMVPYPIVSCVSREKEKAAVKLVMCFTQTTCPWGGASWSFTARSPFRWANRYHRHANNSQWARKEAQKASRTHLHRRPTKRPHKSCRASSHALAETPHHDLEGQRGGVREQCPSLVTRRWRSGEDRRGEEEAFPPRTLLVDFVVMVRGWSEAGQVEVKRILKQDGVDNK